MTIYVSPLSVRLNHFAFAYVGFELDGY